MSGRVRGCEFEREEDGLGASKERDEKRQAPARVERDLRCRQSGGEQARTHQSTNYEMEKTKKNYEMRASRPCAR